MKQLTLFNYTKVNESDTTPLKRTRTTDKTVIQPPVRSSTHTRVSPFDHNSYVYSDEDDSDDDGYVTPSETDDEGDVDISNEDTSNITIQLGKRRKSKSDPIESSTKRRRLDFTVSEQINYLLKKTAPTTTPKILSDDFELLESLVHPKDNVTCADGISNRIIELTITTKVS